MFVSYFFSFGQLSEEFFVRKLWFCYGRKINHQNFNLVFVKGPGGGECDPVGEAKRGEGGVG
jgi:hypothetical protein